MLRFSHQARKILKKLKKTLRGKSDQGPPMSYTRSGPKTYHYLRHNAIHGMVVYLAEGIPTVNLLMFTNWSLREIKVGSHYPEWKEVETR